MSNKIKQIILTYLDVEVLDYKDEDRTYIKLSNGETMHEKDLLDESIEVMKEKLNESIDDGNFYDTKKLLSSLQDIVTYYMQEWCA